MSTELLGPDIIGQRVSDRIEMIFTCNSQLGHPYVRSIQDWNVTVNLQDIDNDDDDEYLPEGESAIASFGFVKVNIVNPPVDLWELADELPWMEKAGFAIFNRKGLTPEAEERTQFGGWALLGNGMYLAPHWRGQGFGRFLVATAIEHLYDDVRIVAFAPGPMLGEDEELSDEAEAAAKRKLTKVWKSIGFRKFKDGVVIMDPVNVHFENALESLRVKFGLA